MKKRGICFSGGGIKIFAHIGALKAIEEKNLKFDMISGASSGSIVAILYALGYTSDQMYNLVNKYIKKIRYIDRDKIFKIIFGVIFKGKIIVDGLNSGNILRKAIKDICQENKIYNINQLKMPVAISAVNLQNGEVIIFSSKQIRKTISDKVRYITDVPIDVAVRSSCSYPGVFSPYMYEGNQLIDGGVRENLPWKELKDFGAESVLGINFKPIIEDEKLYNNMVEVAINSIGLVSHELSNYEINGIDNLITIKTKKVGLLDFKKAQYLYEEGYMTTKKYLEKVTL